MGWVGPYYGYMPLLAWKGRPVLLFAGLGLIASILGPSVLWPKRIALFFFEIKRIAHFLLHTSTWQPLYMVLENLFFVMIRCMQALE